MSKIYDFRTKKGPKKTKKGTKKSTKFPLSFLIKLPIKENKTPYPKYMIP